MLKNLIVLVFFLIVPVFCPSLSYAEPKHGSTQSFEMWGRDFHLFRPKWSKEHGNYNQMKRFHPYLEDSRHSQVPQWDHQDWYLEDWSYGQDGLKMVQGFYEADIFRDQILGHANVPTLIVGPNFYHLSGFDKRRVVATLDHVYGVSKRSQNGTFLLEDWNSKRTVGVFDGHGLRLF